MNDSTANQSRNGSAFMLFLLIYNVIISFVVLPLAVGTMMALDIDPRPIFFSPWFTIFSQLLILLLPLTIWLAIKRDRLTRHLPDMSLGGTNIILIVFMSIFIQPAMMFISGLMSLLFPNTVAVLLSEMAQYPLWLMILAAAVTPAIIEEVVFRGYIQSTHSSKNTAFWKIAVVNGLFFGIIHMNLQQFTYAFLMGIVFAYMVYYTRSIRAAVLSHFIINGTQVTLLHWSIQAQQMLEQYAPAPGAVTDTYYVTDLMDLELPFDIPIEVLGILGIAVIAMIATPGAYLLFRTFVTHNRQRNLKHEMFKYLPHTTQNSNLIPPVEQDNEFVLDKQEDDSTSQSRFPFDPYLVAVVVLFIIVMVGTMFM